MDALFPLHPRFVHFPIALSLVGIAFIVCGLGRRQARWRDDGRVTLLLGWIGVLAAALTGLVDESRAPDSPAVSALINQHITTGIALLIVLGLALYWPFRYRRLDVDGSGRWGYLALLGLGAVLVVFDGWLGGKLVYSLGVGVAP